MIQWIETFIIMNPWESVIFMFLVCTFFGMYMEDVFKIWNWGPICDKCKEHTFWSTSKSYCDECNHHTNNDEYQSGYNAGAESVRKDLLGL